MGVVKDMVGKKFGKLLVIGRATSPDSVRTREVYWLCRCDCGSTKRVQGGHLRRGKIKSCGCLSIELVTKRNKERVLDSGEANMNRLWVRYHRGARTRGLSFLLERSEFEILVTSNCYYCKSPPSLKFKTSSKYYGDLFYNGIDRVDNAVGYIKGNCVPCCKQCNYAKSTLGRVEFYEWVSQVYLTLKERERDCPDCCH